MLQKFCQKKSGLLSGDYLHENEGKGFKKEEKKVDLKGEWSQEGGLSPGVPPSAREGWLTTSVCNFIT